MVGMLLAQAVAPPVVGHSAVRPAVSRSRLGLERPPYAGVRCPGANSIACDRIGLAVWLTRRPTTLRATIAGHTFTLRPPPPGSRSRGGYWEGSLRPAGMLRPGAMHVVPDAGSAFWAGRHPRAFWVQLTASSAHEPPASIRVRVQLRPGWG
jgi:hypothetical protein